jgi:hypothetical protein
LPGQPRERGKAKEWHDKTRQPGGAALSLPGGVGRKPLAQGHIILGLLQVYPGQYGFQIDRVLFTAESVVAQKVDMLPGDR